MSFSYPGSSWPVPARPMAQNNLGRTRRAERQIANLPPVAMYINAVYYPNYRASASRPPASLPLDTISHIFYAFAAVQSDGTVYLSNPAIDTQASIDGTQGAVRACANLKQQRPYLKLVLSIGGADGSNQNFASTASTPSARQNFAISARSLIDQYNFDGIDIDWEYPEPGTEASNYILLLASLRAYLPAPQYIISVALPAGEWCLDRFDLIQLALNIDLLNLMAYDFCGNWGNPIISGHQAALYAPHGGGSTAPVLQYLLSNHFPANKILLGCPVYGWSFLNCDNINQATTMCGNPPNGCFDYSQLPRPGTQELVDGACVATFCVGGDGGFVTYDNPESVQMKANWAKQNGLAGLFFWHVLADAQGTRSLVYNSYVALHS